jgi:hypothetical protein
MLKFAQFSEMMKIWNDGPGVEEAMVLRLRDATRNTNWTYYASCSTTLLCNEAKQGGREWTQIAATGSQKLNCAPRIAGASGGRGKKHGGRRGKFFFDFALTIFLG